MSGWDRKYWDIVDQLYWTPKYLGFRSIPQRHWDRQEGTICVPAELVNPTGPLYTRDRRAADTFERLHRQEEILNHLFDITFAIAPDDVLARLFCSPLDIDDRGPFESLGREIRARYGLRGNVTQQDGFFVSGRSAIGVELKLDSTSSLGQLAKYVALLALEEQSHGRREHLGLLYILPAKSIPSHWQDCGLSGPRTDASLLERLRRQELPQPIRILFEEKPEEVASVLDRLRVAAISWSDLLSDLRSIEAGLDHQHSGDQTLFRLLSGFRSQLEVHQGTGIMVPTQ